MTYYTIGVKYTVSGIQSNRPRAAAENLQQIPRSRVQQTRCHRIDPSGAAPSMFGIFRQVQCATGHKGYWRKQNGLPIPRDDDTDMKKFINEQIQQHQICAKTTLNFPMMKAFQQQIPSGVIHCEDHHPDRLIWVCPSLCHQCITNTFTNPEVFQVSSTPPLILREATHQRLCKLLPDHKWAKRIHPAQAQKEICDGKANYVLRGGTRPSFTGVLRRRPLSDDSTRVPTSPGTRQRN